MTNLCTEYDLLVPIVSSKIAEKPTTEELHEFIDYLIKLRTVRTEQTAVNTDPLY